jgi:hypothetical protein
MILYIEGAEMSKEQAVKMGITEGKKITIKEFLDSLLENDREDMRAFLSGNAPMNMMKILRPGSKESGISVATCTADRCIRESS